MVSPARQRVPCENAGRAMGGAPKEIKVRHIGNCMKADPACGKDVAEMLGLLAGDVPND